MSKAGDSFFDNGIYIVIIISILVLGAIGVCEILSGKAGLSIKVESKCEEIPSVGEQPASSPASSFELDVINLRLADEKFMATDFGKQYREVLVVALSDDKLTVDESGTLVRIWLDYVKPSTTIEDVKKALKEQEAK